MRAKYVTSSSPRETGRGGVMEQIREHLGKKLDLVIFRNQGGAAEVKGQWQSYGLTNGASDLIGLLKPSGRFFACEVKKPGGRRTPEQKLFIDLVNNFGGYGFFAESVEEAEHHYLVAGGKHLG